ncbi:MAG TPA: hypothetical protein VFY89_02995, partial [Ktedonobacterales bacterium]
MALENTPSPTDMPIARFRIERGDTVVGTDGVLGQVEQIIVEREDRQLRSLIMRGADSTEEIELPANHIVRTLEHQVELNIGRNDLTRRADLATPYDPNQFVPIFEGPQEAKNVAGEVSAESGEPVVTEVESDAAELVSARPEIAPEGELETVAVNPPSGETARGEDRVIETPSIVPAAELAPEAAFKLPEDKDLMGAEAPPTPTGRQLPPSGQTSPSAASPEQVEEEEFELVEQYEPFFLPENVTFREAGVPWRALMVITGVAAAGATAGFLVWRWRHARATRVKGKVALTAGKTEMRAGRWRPKQAARSTAQETRQRLRETLERARQSMGEARENLPRTAQTSQRLTDAAKTPTRRLRWFRRGAGGMRALTRLQMLGARAGGAPADSGEMPELAETRPVAPTRGWIILRPSRVPDRIQTPS